MKTKKSDSQSPLREGQFWRINGIGDLTDQELHTGGIETFAQLADTSPDELALLLKNQDGVKKRAIRQDWTKQARQLAEQIPDQASLVQPPLSAGERQHYQSFLVVLTLEDEHSVCKTEITRVRDGKKDSWSGWETSRLEDWIMSQSGLRLPQSEPFVDEASTAENQGELDITHSVLVIAGSAAAKRFIFDDQEILLNITLLAHLPAALAEKEYEYVVAVLASHIGVGKRIQAAEERGKLHAELPLELSIPLYPFSAGTYSLEIYASASQPKAPLGQSGPLHAFCDAGIIHVLSREVIAG